MRSRHVVVVLLVLALAATAAAQCSVGPNTASVTLPDFLAVYYSQFRSLSEEDAAEFYGGVCVTAVGGEWTVIAESVRVNDLRGDIKLEAPSPTLYMAEWRMTGDLLRASATGLTLANARVVGPDMAGSAGDLHVDLLTGQMSMTRLKLEGSALALRGDLAVLEGNALRVEGAGLTTCIGLEAAPYEVMGDVALVNLTDLEVRLSGGSLRVGRLTVPLREEIVVSDTTLAAVELPVKVAFHSGGVQRGGAGLDIRIVGIPAAPNVNLVLGGTGLDADHAAGPVVLFEVQAEQPEHQGVSQVNAVAGLEAGQAYVDVAVNKKLAPWLDLGFSVHSGAAPARQALHEGKVQLTATQALPLFGANSGLRTTLTGRVFTAVTAVTQAANVAEPQAMGPRLGAAGTATTTWRATRVSTFTLVSGAEATYYPVTSGTQVTTAGPAVQWGVRLAPTWRYVNGPITLSLAYDARFTNAASPFGTFVDRLTPLQRLTGSFRIAGEILTTERGVWSGAFGVQAQYDPFITTTLPGLKRLTFDGSVSYAVEPWKVTLGAVTEVAGVITPVGRNPYVQVELTAERGGWPVLNPQAEAPNVPHGTLQLGVMTNYSLAPGSEGLTALELSAAVPLTFDTMELRPYLAFDFAPTVLHGLWPWWSGYGLDATFITCCGSLTLSVMNDRGAWGAGIGIDLERRPPREPGPHE
ncbi:MAG: hypothetical protein WDA15_03750 [Trueperaceae bacterium]